MGAFVSMCEYEWKWMMEVKRQVEMDLKCSHRNTYIIGTSVVLVSSQNGRDLYHSGDSNVLSHQSACV